MKRITFPLLVFSLLLISFPIIALSGEPKAIIQAKSTAAVNESVWLRTTGSVGKSFYWKILPTDMEANTTILPIFGGMDKDNQPIVSYWCHFSSSKACTVYFLFIATEGDKSDIATHTLVYGGGSPDPNPPDPVVPEIPKPSEDIVTVVQPLAALVSGTNSTQLKTDLKNLKQFYSDLADTVQKDASTKVIKTTEHLRLTHVNAGNLMFSQTGIKGRYTGLGSSINKVLANKLGLAIAELTDSKRTDAVNMFRGIAWAMQERLKAVK